MAQRAKMTIVAALVLAIGVITGSAVAVDEGLYTACAPMNVFVEPLPSEESQKAGLTREAIMDAVESRLRSARLFASAEKQVRHQYLRVNVNVLGYAFSVGVELRRFLEDLGYGFGGYAVVWDVGAIGTHSGDGQYILGSVTRYLDRFIVSYLRINEEHCSR